MPRGAKTTRGGGRNSGTNFGRNSSSGGNARSGGRYSNNLPDYGFGNQQYGQAQANVWAGSSSNGYGQTGSNYSQKTSAYSDNWPSNTSSGGYSNNYGQNSSGYSNYDQNTPASGFSINYGQNNRSSGYGQNDSGANFSNDSFGQINDTPKQSSSDELIKELGKCLLSSLSGGNNTNVGFNPLMKNKMLNLLQTNQSGRGGLYGDNPSRYDGYYNSANFYDSVSYQGGYGQKNQNYNRNRYLNASQAFGFRKFNQTRGKPTGGNVQNKGKSGAGNVIKKVDDAKKIANKQPLKPKAKGKGKKKGMQRVRDRYKYSVQNKFLDESQIPLVTFLKTLLGDLCGTDNLDHYLLLSRFLGRHPNAVKLFVYENKVWLDKKFGEETTEEVIKKKLEYLNEKKTKFVEETKKLTKFRTDEKFNEKVKLIEEKFELLSGEKFTNADIPTPEEYVTNPEKTHEDFVSDFKYFFVRCCYEKFNFKLIEEQIRKSSENRLNFHLNNSFIPLILIERIKKNRPVKKLPPILAKFTREIKQEAFLSHETILQNTYDKMVKRDEHLQTNITDYLKETKVSTEILRDFADCVLFFDKIATAIKFKLINYTQFINLPRELKLKLFNELVSRVYTECLHLLKNNIKLLEHTYTELVKEEGEEDGENKKTNGDDAKQDAKMETD